MKKLSLLVTLLALCATPVILSSCGDDEDNSPTYELELFLGEWELTNSTNPEYKSCESDPPILTITNDNLIVPAIDTSDGCMAGSATLDYSFSGRSFTTEIFGVSVKYTIQSATETEFKWKDNFEGYTETYSKIN